MNQLNLFDQPVKANNQKRSSAKDIILTAIIREETDKAILIEYEEINPPETKRVWLPLSQITIKPSRQNQGNLFGAPVPQKQLTIPHWLAKQKGI